MTMHYDGPYVAEPEQVTKYDYRVEWYDSALFSTRTWDSHDPAEARSFYDQILGLSEIANSPFDHPRLIRRTSAVSAGEWRDIV